MASVSNLIPVYLVNTAGVPQDVLTFSPGEVLAGVDASAMIDALGVLANVGRGLWVYPAAPTEMSGRMLTLSVEQAGLQPYAFSTPVPVPTEMLSGAGYRRVPVKLVDAAGADVPGIVDWSLAFVMLPGSLALVGASGVFTDTGSGFYTYDAAPSEIATPGLVVLLVATTGVNYVYAWYVGQGVVTPPAPVPVVVSSDLPPLLDLPTLAISRLPDQFRSHEDP